MYNNSNRHYDTSTQERGVARPRFVVQRPIVLNEETSNPADNYCPACARPVRWDLDKKSKTVMYEPTVSKDIVHVCS